MSFWENVKKFAQPYADDEYDDETDEETEEGEEVTEEETEEAPKKNGRKRSPFDKVQDTADTGSATSTASTGSTASGTERSGSTGFAGTILNSGSAKQEVVLFHAKSFDDAAKAADELRKRKAVILNMENVDKALTRRVVDFLSGAVYALDGSVKKVALGTYLFCPHNMTVVGDLENLQSEAESYM